MTHYGSWLQHRFGGKFQRKMTNYKILLRKFHILCSQEILNLLTILEHLWKYYIKIMRNIIWELENKFLAMNFSQISALKLDESK